MNQKSATFVIPCFNESQRLKQDDILQFLELHPQVHILFVNDGSSDDTLMVLNQLKSQSGQIEVLSFDQNCGKAEAVRRGMMNAFELFQDEYIGYWDADLATPFSQFELFQNHFNSQLLMILGSRIQRLGSLIDRQLLRHYLGRVFATFASSVLKLKVYDTQCGAKFFHRKIVQSLFSEKFISYWIFDVEIIARFKGLDTFQLDRIIEIPLLEWKDVKGSRLKVRDFLKAPLELFKIAGKYKNGY